MARITGQVVSVTEEGDLITDIKAVALGDAPRDERLSVQCDGHSTVGLYKSKEDQPPMTLIAFENESGAIQLSITEGDMSGFLGIKTGSEVIAIWK